MLPRLLADPDRPDLDRWLWLLMGALVVAQIAAMWMLCQSQVERAQARESSLHAERLALADCQPTAFVGADGTLVRTAPGPRCGSVRQVAGKPAD